MNVPDCALLGSLKPVIESIDAGNYLLAIDELKIQKKIRPFHPEAVLQQVDLFLRDNDEKSAALCSAELLTMTPEWDIAKKLATKLIDEEVLTERVPLEDQFISFCMIFNDF